MNWSYLAENPKSKENKHLPRVQPCKPKSQARNWIAKKKKNRYVSRDRLSPDRNETEPETFDSN